MTSLLRRLFRRGRRDSSDDTQVRGGPWAQAWTRLRRKKVAFAALILIVILYVGGALAPWTAPRDYRETPSTNLEDLPGFQGLVISPRWTEDSTLYNYTPIGVFRSENAGGSWEQVNTGLGAVNVDVLAPVSIDGATSLVFAGTPQGIFVSRDGASTWAEASDGLPENRGVKHLAASPSIRVGRQSQLQRCRVGCTGAGDQRVEHGLTSTSGFQSEAPCRVSRRLLTRLRTLTARSFRNRNRTEDRVISDRRGSVPFHGRRHNLDAPVYEASAGRVSGGNHGDIAGLRSGRHCIRHLV